MTATAQTAQPPGRGRLRALFETFLGEPLELIQSQPHQALISTGSVALMAQFAASSNIVHAAVGYCIAGGVEWAYLRGLASDSRAHTRWGGILNWSAFAIVVLWGVLWCAQQFGAVDPHATGAIGFLLAGAHVVPIAWLSLCSAQCHRAAIIAEQAEQLAAQERKRVADEQEAAEQRAWELAQAEEDRKLERWERAYRIKSELKIAEQSVNAAMQPASAKMRRDARPASMDAESQICPNCGIDIPSRSTWLAARRWGRCAACKGRE